MFKLVFGYFFKVINLTFIPNSRPISAEEMKNPIGIYLLVLVNQYRFYIKQYPCNLNTKLMLKEPGLKFIITSMLKGWAGDDLTLQLPKC